MDVQEGLKPPAGMSKHWDVAELILSMVCKGEAVPLEHMVAFLASLTLPKLSRQKCRGQKRVSEHVSAWQC